MPIPVETVCGNCMAANNVDLALVEAQTQIVASTVPAKKDNDTDFAYGIPKELLTQAFLYTDGAQHKTTITIAPETIRVACRHMSMPRKAGRHCRAHSTHNLLSLSLSLQDWRRIVRRS